jgi:hypothetical protein
LPNIGKCEAILASCGRPRANATKLKINEQILRRLAAGTPQGGVPASVAVDRQKVYDGGRNGSDGKTGLTRRVALISGVQ